VTLNYHGLVDRDVMTKRYSLGVALLEYGRVALKGLDIRHVAKPFLKALVDYSGETAALAVLRGTRITIVDTEESPNPMRVSLSIAMGAPATTTSNGKAVLAYLPEKQLNEIIKIEGLPTKTKKSITKIKAYRTELAAIRKRGYATDFGEYQEWIVGVSAPIFDAQGQVMGAISISGPLFRMTKERVRNYGKKCAEMTIQISALLR
jgi:IclR family acetate operon transcriptional repressor